jgi:hypothetical protein
MLVSNMRAKLEKPEKQSVDLDQLCALWHNRGKTHSAR